LPDAAWIAAGIHRRPGGTPEVGIELGPNQYGKAEVRVVAVDRSGPDHAVKDLTVSTALRGDFAAAHLAGDNAHVLPTDTQKNAVFALARDGVGEIEDFGLRVARHLAGAYPWIRAARVHVVEQPWLRLSGTAFAQSGGETRSATVTVEGGGEHVLSGLSGLVLLKTTGSAFTGFPRDPWTTLEETEDRILATAVTARWRHTGTPDWAASFAAVRAALVGTFAGKPSDALQQTLFDMGAAALGTDPELAEIRLSLPNRHHFLQDLAQLGLDNPKLVYRAEDRPYGLIEGTVQRDDAPPPGPAWD
jgi:urate oxidase